MHLTFPAEYPHPAQALRNEADAHSIVTPDGFNSRLDLGSVELKQVLLPRDTGNFVQAFFVLEKDKSGLGY